MANRRAVKSSEASLEMRPALSPEARENQLISLAVDLAERKLRDGTASSSMVLHYLELASTKERTKQALLEKQMDLIEAKTEAIYSGQRVEELYLNALDAMRRYSGHGDSDED